MVQIYEEKAVMQLCETSKTTLLKRQPTKAIA